MVGGTCRGFPQDCTIEAHASDQIGSLARLRVGRLQRDFPAKQVEQRIAALNDRPRIAQPYVPASDSFA
jgi:hypothetical protein